MPAPSTNAFTVIGAFPFCAPEVDVSIYDYWITLGGFKKGDSGSPSAAQLDDSEIKAMWLYRRLYALNTSYDDNGTAETLETNSIDDLKDGKSEPENRECPDVDDKYGCQFTQFKQFMNGSSGVGSDLYGSTGQIVRMMNGSDFVGYGISGGFDADYTNDTLAFSPFAAIEINSYVDARGDEQRYDEVLDLNDNTYPCVATFFADDPNVGSAPYTVDPDDLKISFSYTDGSTTTTFSVQLDNIELFSSFT